MLPTNSEWLELFVVFALGPLHALTCAVAAAIAWWRASRWSSLARVKLLVINLLLASAPVATGLAVDSTNRDYQQFAHGVVGAEVIAMLGLVAALITRR